MSIKQILEMVLTEEHCNYEDLQEFGTVTISYGQSGPHVRVESFGFHGASSCRHASLKAMTWARDVLNQHIEATKLAPGGGITGSID